MLENKASEGMTFTDRLADGQCRPKFASEAAATAPVGERGKREGRVEAAELGRNGPQIAGNAGNPLNKDGRQPGLRVQIHHHRYLILIDGEV
jgi:hypothetical protein